MSDNTEKLAELRKPIPDNLVSRFPSNAGKLANQEYAGHAAVTDRLLEVDPTWTWDFHTESGFPEFDEFGGMWIKLTVCGTTKLGYGFAERMSGGNGIKEAIGDAIRNAAMRFGVGLEFWHKGDLMPEPVELATESELKLIHDLLNLRVEHFEVQAVNFMNWLKSNMKVDNLDTLPKKVVPDVVAMLQRPPKGHQWPEGLEIPQLTGETE